MIMRNKISRLWASSKTCERSSLSAFALAATTAAKWCFVMQRLNGAPFAKPAKAPFAQLATANHKAQVFAQLCKFIILQSPNILEDIRTKENGCSKLCEFKGCLPAESSDTWCCFRASMVSATERFAPKHAVMAGRRGFSKGSVSGSTLYVSSSVSIA